MPPINKSNNVDAKEYFLSTLNIPIANAGYYVIPPFLSMEILKKENAYDAERFIDGSLLKFNEIFGADLVVFTIIHNWKKSALSSTVNVDIEYVIKSTKSNKTIFSRQGYIIYDTSEDSESYEVIDMAISLIASAINSASIKYVDVARFCNSTTLKDLPAGRYSHRYNLDSLEIAGQKNFIKRFSHDNK